MRSDSVWYKQMNPAIYIQTPLWRVTRFHAVVQIYPDIFIRAYMHGDRSSDRTKSASGEEDWGVYVCVCVCVLLLLLGRELWCGRKRGEKIRCIYEKISPQENRKMGEVKKKPIIQRGISVLNCRSWSSDTVACGQVTSKAPCYKVSDHLLMYALAALSLWHDTQMGDFILISRGLFIGQNLAEDRKASEFCRLSFVTERRPLIGPACCLILSPRPALFVHWNAVLQSQLKSSSVWR